MIRKLKNKMLMGLAMVLGIMTMPTLALAAQTESPVACNEGVILEPITLVYGDHTTGCEINVIADLDVFHFDGSEGDDIRIIIQSTTPGLDPRLELRDPDGVLIVDTYCNGNNVYGQPVYCSFEVDRSLVLGGTYSIALSDQGVNETGFYTLQLERIPPVAPPLPFNIPVTDAIDPATDLDFIEFAGNAGALIRLTITSLTPGFDPALEVWDPEGVLIEDTFCNGNNVYGQPVICSISIDISPALTGAYMLAVSDANNDEIGDYQVDLRCVVGPCEGVPATRPECEIEMNQAIYIDGEEVIANVLRLANPTPDPLALEVKIWLGLPGSSTPVLNLGSNGSFILPAGFDTDLGPASLFTIDPGFARGSYEFSCRMLDPVTGRLLREDRNFFDVQ